MSFLTSLLPTTNDKDPTQSSVRTKQDTGVMLSGCLSGISFLVSRVGEAAFRQPIAKIQTPSSARTKQDKGVMLQ